jgi:hypothetical protein
MAQVTISTQIQVVRCGSQCISSVASLFGGGLLRCQSSSGLLLYCFRRHRRENRWPPDASVLVPVVSRWSSVRFGGNTGALAMIPIWHASISSSDFLPSLTSWVVLKQKYSHTDKSIHSPQKKTNPYIYGNQQV